MITAVNKIDDYTVEIVLEDQISDILYYIAYPTLGILNKAAVEADEANGYTIGCGPYVFDSWSNGDNITMHAFEDYYGGVKPTKNLTFRIMPEASSRVTRFRPVRSTSASILPPRAQPHRRGLQPVSSAGFL